MAIVVSVTTSDDQLLGRFRVQGEDAEHPEWIGAEVLAQLPEPFEIREHYLRREEEA